MMRIVVRFFLGLWLSGKVLPAKQKKIINEFSNDFLNYKGATLKSKLWAYRRGFLSERIRRYGLTEENYRHYASDLQYAHPSAYINGPRSRWYDDKLATYYVLKPFSDYMPNHYFFVKDNEMYPISHDDKANKTLKDVLINQKRLIIKHVWGAGGKKLYLAEYKSGSFYLNNKIIDEEDLFQKVKSLDQFIITDYVQSHFLLSKINENSLNTLRIVTGYDKKTEEAYITGAFLRFGTHKTGFVDNASAGGIVVGVDIENGTTLKAILTEGGLENEIASHPESGESLNLVIPRWKNICDKLKEISNYLCVTPFLSYDIAVTPDSFKILEINSHGMQRNVQRFYPLFSNPVMCQLFGHLKK